MKVSIDKNIGKELEKIFEEALMMACKKINFVMTHNPEKDEINIRFVPKDFK